MKSWFQFPGMGIRWRGIALPMVRSKVPADVPVTEMSWQPLARKGLGDAEPPLIEPSLDRVIRLQEVPSWHPPSSLSPWARSVRRKLRMFLGHPSLRYLQTFYAGLGACVLYHRVRREAFDTNAPSPYQSLSVSAERFEEQAAYIKKHFKCLSLPRAAQLLRERRLPAKSLVITFDDGYKDNLEVALPILEKYELPATIYVASGLVDRTADLWWFEQEFIINRVTKLTVELGGQLWCWETRTVEQKYRAIERLNCVFRRLPLATQKAVMARLRAQCSEVYSYDDIMMTWDEVRKADAHPLITIGAHTVHHAMLSRLPEKEMERELIESRRRLEQELGHPVVHFAYPFGGKEEAGAREFKVARECGFVSAVTTRTGHLFEKHRETLQSLPRISIIYDDSIETVAWKLSGLYTMVHHRGRRFLED